MNKQNPIIHPRGHSKFGFRYNWKPDLPDRRDLFLTGAVSLPTELPTSVDLRPKCSPVFNQGKIGSCTGNALAGALEFLELDYLNSQKGELKNNRIYDDKEFTPVSRLYIYYNERLLEGTTAMDAGASLRDGVKSLQKFGACREEIWNYLPTLVFKKPTAKAYKEGEKHPITSYYRLRSAHEIKASLALGFPVSLGISVYESFESLEVARTGNVPVPGDDERLIGGHAVLAVGYVEAENYFIVRNSWGDDWGDRGYFRLPYEYIDNAHLAADFWVIKK